MDAIMEEDDDLDLEDTTLPVLTPVMPTTMTIATPTITTSMMKGSQRRLDPKLLDKPEPYDGAEIGWRIWKLREVGWLIAVDILSRIAVCFSDGCSPLAPVVATTTSTTSTIAISAWATRRTDRPGVAVLVRVRGASDDMALIIDTIPIGRDIDLRSRP